MHEPRPERGAERADHLAQVDLDPVAPVHVDLQNVREHQPRVQVLVVVAGERRQREARDEVDREVAALPMVCDHLVRRRHEARRADAEVLDVRRPAVEHEVGEEQQPDKNRQRGDDTVAQHDVVIAIGRNARGDRVVDDHHVDHDKVVEILAQGHPPPEARPLFGRRGGAFQAKLVEDVLGQQDPASAAIEPPLAAFLPDAIQLGHSSRFAPLLFINTKFGRASGFV